MSGAERLRARAVVFDLDGTLIDSRADIAAAANYALGLHGFVQRSLEDISTYVGDGAKLLVARAAGLDADDARVAALRDAFIAYYGEHPTVFSKFCPGAEAALAELADLPLALCTNKPRVTTERVLEGMALTGIFRSVVAGDDLPLQKPDPAPLLHIARELGRDPRELVMVGDGAQDIFSARAAGAFAIGVLGGIQGEERLLSAAPDCVVHTLLEVPAIVRRLL